MSDGSSAWVHLRSKVPSGSEGLPQLVPSHLPHRFLHKASRVSGRCRSRRSLDVTCILLAEYLWTFLAFLGAGEPKSSADYGSAVSPTWMVSLDAEASFRCLVDEVRAFCRLSPQSWLGNGRGIGNATELVKLLVDSQPACLASAGGNEIASLVKGALPVEVHNCGIPDRAGLVNPELILKEPRLSEFQNQQRWRDDSMIFDLPKPCYMVKPEDEHAYQSKMLGSRMAGLIPELEVPRRGDGSLLLEGQFNVAGSKPEGKKRLIFDARPSNEREELQDWLELPVGFMLKSMVLRPGHGVRGSGSELTAMFSQLREEWGQPWV